MKPGDRLCVALDFSGRAAAIAAARRLQGRAGWFKIGLELFVSEGPDLVAEISRSGRVFLDLKLHDIPNTAAAAIAAAVRTGAALVNVHAAGGREMMMRAGEAAAQEAAARGLERPLVVAVTVLTSLDGAALAEIGLAGTPEEAASRLARLAREAGLDGVVCSSGDLARIRRDCGSDFWTVVPGIRPEFAAAQDQKRTARPSEAIEAGASLIVVGRPITRAADLEAAADAVLREMEAVMGRES